jgi:hypothetical protein
MCNGVSGFPFTKAGITAESANQDEKFFLFLEVVLEDSRAQNSPREKLAGGAKRRHLFALG